MNVSPQGVDPREFALQLAVVSERLDERSALAAERMELASVHLEQRTAEAVKHMAAECTRVGTAHRAATEARVRMLWMLSAGLLAATLAAAAVAASAVGSARRELAAIQRDQTLTHAINQADLTLCGGRLCARIEGEGGDTAAYRPIALR
ncbi:hypothetical protein ACW5F0_05820 [Luteimonas sp. A534]